MLDHVDSATGNCFIDKFIIWIQISSLAGLSLSDSSFHAPVPQSPLQRLWQPPTSHQTGHKCAQQHRSAPAQISVHPLHPEVAHVADAPLDMYHGDPMLPML